MTNVCQGAVFTPWASLLNAEPDNAYVGKMRVYVVDRFVWDSISLFGSYTFNKTKTAVVDTLRLVFLTGSGNGIGPDDIFSGYSMHGGHYDTNKFLEMTWDSVTNTASSRAHTLTYTKDIYLDNSGASPAWGDTLPNGIWTHNYATNGATGISTYAAAFCGMSITFISGDPATKTGLLSTPTPGDTLVGYYKGSGMNEYNVWRPLVNYYTTLAGTPDWPPYQCPIYEPIAVDHNLGYWKRLRDTGWGNVFIPAWGMSMGSSPSNMQHPYISYHIVCATCDNVPYIPSSVDKINANNINNACAMPNPTCDILNVNFSLAQASDVTVSLINMIAQVVATQNVDKCASGKATFNTSALPAGMYIYKVQANGAQTVGKVLIEH